jgi:hypothetical protein
MAARVRFTPTSARVLLAVLGFVLPALADLCSPSWKRRVFGWVAADTFYYVTVARNVVRYGRVAYDQTNPNNGFHPLWQLLCAGLAWILDRPPAHDWLLSGVVLVGVGFIAAAIPLLGRTLTARGRSLSVFFPLLPVGAYAFLVMPIWARGMPSMARQNSVEGPMPLYGTLWTDANGMETCLVVFFLALSGWIFTLGDVTTRPRRAFAFGLALSGLVLSRLDHMLLILPLLAGIGVSVLVTRGLTKPLLLLVSAFSLPVGLYLFLNHHYYGTLVPVSGALKSSFPHVDNQNLDDLVAFWRGPWRGLFLIEAYRQLAAAIPAFAAILYLFIVVEVRPLGRSVMVRLRPWTTRYDVFLASLAPGVVLLALYNILFVQWFYQGHWYFPASTLFVSLAFFSLAAPLEAKIARSLADLAERLGKIPAAVLSAAWLAACAACVVFIFAHFHRQLGYHQKLADFYFDEAPKVRAYYGDPMPKFLEDDDGIIAYSLGAPTMSMGLGLDPEGAAALSHGDLLELALERHYDRLTSLVYVTGEKLGTAPSPGDLKKWAKDVVTLDDSKPYKFALDYRSSDGQFAILKAWKN